jgi:hypothetical protein
MRKWCTSFFTDKELVAKKTLLKKVESHENADLIQNEILHNLQQEFLSNDKEWNYTEIGQDVYEDIEMFRPYKENEPTIFSLFNHHKFIGSSQYTRHVLSYPLQDDVLLNKRKSLLQSISPYYVEIRENFQSMSMIEKDILWLFHKNDDNVKKLYDMPFFRLHLLSQLNKNPTSLTCYNIYQIFISPMIGILSPITYFIVPFLVLRHRYKLNVPFKTYVRLLFASSQFMFKANGWSVGMQYASMIFSLVFYFQSLFNSIEVSKTLYSVNKMVTNRIETITQFLVQGKTIIEQHKNALAESHVFFGTDFNIENITLTKNCEFFGDCRSASNKKFLGWWCLTNFGTFLKTYKYMDVENIKYWLDALYRLDSLTTLLEVKNLLNMSYISYGSCEDDNILLLKELWHPSLHPDKIVKNNVVKNIHNRNMIITGPNAGGKSTLVKAILTNIIMGQTITMNCATQSIFVPFSLITSQINVPDCKGKESLFQAEMNRCKKVFERLKNVEQGKRAIVFMDEILSSTNPIEGIAGSYAILKNLTKYDNCAVVFTTHYNYLSKLEKVTDKIYMNYKMNVRVEDDDIDFLYTLSRGVSNQYIALKLLEKEGFDKEIISDALTLKERLCHVRPPSCV